MDSPDVPAQNPQPDLVQSDEHLKAERKRAAAFNFDDAFLTQGLSNQTGNQSNNKFRFLGGE